LPDELDSLLAQAEGRPFTGCLQVAMVRGGMWEGHLQRLGGYHCLAPLSANRLADSPRRLTAAASESPSMNSRSAAVGTVAKRVGVRRPRGRADCGERLPPCLPGRMNRGKWSRA
jgi:hypothetical protein